MAAVSETRACLRIFGDDLDPDAISALLGASPTSSAKKGEDRLGPNGIKRGTERTGRWLLEVAPRIPGDLDGQIVELLSPLNPDIAMWRDLVARFLADIYCGFFMCERNEHLELRPETLVMIGSRALSLGVELYDPTPTEDVGKTESSREA